MRGTEGLRVVDASSMPYVTNGNIYAPVVMLAEKAADLIRGNTPLEPLGDVPFYRHAPAPRPSDPAPLHAAQFEELGRLARQLLRYNAALWRAHAE